MSKVKICGLSRAEDIEAVNRAVPDYIGFVFAPGKRQIGIADAAYLKKKLKLGILTVGVFVNEDPRTVANAYQSGVIDIAQLHGNEDDEYINQLKNICGCTVIKAIGINEALPAALPEQPNYLLFDTLLNPAGATAVNSKPPLCSNHATEPFPQTNFGGAGKTFDWGILANYSGPRYFLAGGLNADNIKAALKQLSPFCVDVSSGVETNGRKDAYKIEEFVKLVRGNNSL